VTRKARKLAALAKVLRGPDRAGYRIHVASLPEIYYIRASHSTKLPVGYYDNRGILFKSDVHFNTLGELVFAMLEVLRDNKTV